MRRFTRSALLLALPFLLYFGLVVITDPFEHFGIGNAISHAQKERVSGRLHYALWKSHQYAKSPTRRVIFGDSRLDKLPIDEIEALTGERYFNFSLGGGTVAEMVSAFWFSDARAQLEEVTFGISFFNFSANENMNRFIEAEAVFDDRLLYFVNRSVARAAGQLVWAEITSARPQLEHPTMGRDEFWDYQLRVGAPRIYGRYVYPEAYEGDLQRILEHCRMRGVRVQFVIPPSHVDLQQKVAEFGLLAEQERFRAFLRRAAPTIDFDNPSELTTDRARFGDPFHPMAYKEIVDEVWGNARGLAVHSDP